MPSFVAHSTDNTRESRRLALAKEDQADEELFNWLLWRGIKGDDRPWSGIKRMSALEYRR
jgi:hypothetical protein